MLNGELVETHIKPTENTTLAKLTVFDQIKMLIAHFAKNDAGELDAREKVSAAELTKKAALSKFIETAGQEMQRNGNKSATLSINSEFLPYLDDVIDPIKGYGRYYVFKVYKQQLPYNLSYGLIVQMYKKVSKNALVKGSEKL